MATILTHPLIPIAVRFGLGRDVVSNRLLFVAALATILPDGDVIAFYYDIPYSSQWGHRGFTHSFAFAAALGGLAVVARDYLGASARLAFWFVAISCATHPLLDAMTDGGLGSAFFWPLSDSRYFLPWQPIEVSPIGISRFLSARGRCVLMSEAVWIWLPLALVTAGIWWRRRRG